MKKRSEPVSKCRHEKKFFQKNFEAGINEELAVSWWIIKFISLSIILSDESVNRKFKLMNI